MPFVPMSMARLEVKLMAGDTRIVNFVHAGMIIPAEGDDHRGDAVVIVGEVSHGDDANTGGEVGTLFVEALMETLSRKHRPENASWV